MGLPDKQNGKLIDHSMGPACFLLALIEAGKALVIKAKDMFPYLR
jgi:hypothetical protein